MSNGGADNIRFESRQVTSVSPQDTTEIQLRLIDWRRIYRKIKSISPGVSGRELGAGVAWGVTASALLSLIPLYQATQQLEAWVKPTYWLVALASGIIGYLIFRSAKDYSKGVAETRAELIVEMKEIHCLYFPKENLDEV